MPGVTLDEMVSIGEFRASIGFADEVEDTLVVNEVKAVVGLARLG